MNKKLHLFLVGAVLVLMGCGGSSSVAKPAAVSDQERAAFKDEEKRVMDLEMRRARSGARP